MPKFTYQNTHGREILAFPAELTDNSLAEALGASLAVIYLTHANGYGHWNPWKECDHPSCTRAKERIVALGIEFDW